MKSYFDNVIKEVPAYMHEIYPNKKDTAVITIDMIESHLADGPDCPAPSPRGREIISDCRISPAESLNNNFLWFLISPGMRPAPGNPLLPPGSMAAWHNNESSQAVP